jgi:hypothetical protein
MCPENYWSIRHSVLPFSADPRSLGWPILGWAAGPLGLGTARQSGWPRRDRQLAGRSKAQLSLVASIGAWPSLDDEGSSAAGVVGASARGAGAGETCTGTARLLGGLPAGAAVLPW